METSLVLGVQVAREPYREDHMKWETPKLIMLAYQQAHGLCKTGSAETTGRCNAGPIASVSVCRSGGSAADRCKTGSVAGERCKGGGAVI